MIINSFQSDTREQFLGLLHDEVIGMGSVGSEGDDVSIFGFGIVPEYRNQGYGSELLHLIVESLRQRGKNKITIEVNSNNIHAFKLYQTFGFKIKTAFEYYRKSIANSTVEGVGQGGRR